MYISGLSKSITRKWGESRERDMRSRYTIFIQQTMHEVFVTHPCLLLFDMIASPINIITMIIIKKCSISTVNFTNRVHACFWNNDVLVNCTIFASINMIHLLLKACTAVLLNQISTLNWKLIEINIIFIIIVLFPIIVTPYCIYLHYFRKDELPWDLVLVGLYGDRSWL